MRNWLIIILIGIISISCKQSQKTVAEPETPAIIKERGVYHWKTTFELTPDDTLFIREHKITTIYIRMFDVGIDTDNGVETGEVVPLGTTKFVTPMLKTCSFVPTVYITLKALKKYNGREHELADLILKRIYAMCSWNELGDFRELQYDCDWTKETRMSFQRLCDYTRAQLKERDVILSGTIRLHQIEEAIYPFDKGVLMIYNTGSFANPDTKNSILAYDDVHKYLSVDERITRFLNARQNNCPVIQIAYPAYGWGVVFDENMKFNRLVTNPEEHRVAEGETIRLEMSTYEEIMKVKTLVDSTIAGACTGHILYHLDPDNFKRYKRHEIEDIFN